jgi:hypothetical protein
LSQYASLAEKITFVMHLPTWPDDVFTMPHLPVAHWSSVVQVSPAANFATQVEEEAPVSSVVVWQ